MERVHALRRGLSPRIPGGNVTIDGDTWHFGVSEDTTHMVVIHEPSTRVADEGHNKLLRLNDEKSDLLPLSKAQWSEKDADAKRLEKRRTDATKRLAEIEKEMTAIQDAINASASERLEIPFDLLTEALGGLVTIAPAKAKEKAQTAADKPKVDPAPPIAAEQTGPAPVPPAPKEDVPPTDPKDGYTVDGLSDRQTEALLEAFPTFDSLKGASDEEIMNVDGIGDVALGKIKEWLASPDPAATKAAG